MLYGITGWIVDGVNSGGCVVGLLISTAGEGFGVYGMYGMYDGAWVVPEGGGGG